MSFAVFAAILASQATAAVPVVVAVPNPKAMSSSEIRSFNAKLPRDHRYHIRCVKSADTGSLVKRNLSCRTNEQWQMAEENGNQNARDTVEAMRSKASNSSN